MSSAWPMPSPVIGSVAAAASPTNRVRARCSARCRRRGPGWATPGAATPASASGPRTARMCGRARRSGHSVLHVLDRAADLAAVALDAEADVGPRRRAAGTTRRSPGSRSGSNHTKRSRAARGPDVGEVLPEGVPLAEVARGGHAEVLAHRRPHAVGGDRRTRASTGPMPSTSRTTRSSRSSAPVTAWPVVHLARRRPGRRRGARRRARPAGRRRRRCRRRGAAGRWPRGPTGERDDDVLDRPATTARWPGRGPRSSRRRSAPVVRPSPQILSRGNVALSTTTTSRPARASVMAAAAPAGPPPDHDDVDARSRRPSSRRPRRGGSGRTRCRASTRPSR